MSKQIIIAEQHRIGAVFAEDQIQEIIVSTGQHQVCDIYLGLVDNIVQGIDAAFVNIGDPSRNGFIHVTDLGPLRLRRSAGAITELLVPQQKVLVQIMKEPTGNKGPRLTGNISLPGRYVVLMPFGKGVNLSRRVRSEAERNRLRALAVLIKPTGMGLLVRTEAEGKSEEDIIEDLERLQRQWEKVEQDADSATRAPALLNRDDDFVQRVLRDTYTSDVNRIVVDSPHAVKRVKQYLGGNGRPPEGLFIDHHRERQSILEYFRINAGIRESLKPRVDLPSGGYIIIEPTEALTVIDVNSGSFTRSSNSRETVLWTNCEAATEIARQLRLRNLAGVIVVDFIDMDYRKDKLQVLEHFDRQLRSDKARPQISQLSELGLVELTRKRQGQNIYELFGHTCTQCGGLGHLAHLPGEQGTISLNIDRFGAADRYSPPPVIDIAPPVIQRTWDHGNDPFEPAGEEEENLEVRGDKRRRRRGEKPEIATREENPRVVPRLGTILVQTPESNSAAIANNLANQFNKEEEDASLKPQRAKPMRMPIEPPERISVEMTNEEKEVYAWIGVSPLIKVEREIRNPRTAIVTVVEPGSLPPEPPAAVASYAAEPQVIEDEADDYQENGYQQELEPENAYPMQQLSLTPLPVIVPKSAEILPAEVVTSENSAEANRRRRRRSSAIIGLNDDEPE
jgi:ribonuclease E